MEPLQKNSIFSGSVRSLSTEGHGVVEGPDGRVFFVPGSWPGDRGTFQVISLKSRYGYAEVKEITVPSEDRRAPLCPHQGYGPSNCGGCPWMIGTYESQLKYKQQKIAHSFKRAGFENIESILSEIIPSCDEWGYRNRAQFKTDGKVLGFVAAETRSLVPIESCKVLSPRMVEVFGALRSSLPRKDWEPGPGFQWNYIDCDEDTEISSPVLNKRRPFRQANDYQNTQMHSWLNKNLQNSQSLTGPVLELFAGSGNLTRVLVQCGRKVIAVEGVENSLQELGSRFGVEVQTLCLDLFRHGEVRYLLKAPSVREAQTVVLDPPREGAKIVCESLGSLPTLKQIFYISCDVATLVRDALALKKWGFDLRQVQPVDMFPQTPHVETLVYFSR